MNNMNIKIDKELNLKESLKLDKRNNVLYIGKDGIMFLKGNKLFCVTNKDILNIFDVSKNNSGRFEYFDYNKISLFKDIDLDFEEFYKAVKFHYINENELVIEVTNGKVVQYKFNINEIYNCQKYIGPLEDIYISINYPVLKVKCKYGYAYIKGSKIKN